MYILQAYTTFSFGKIQCGGGYLEYTSMQYEPLDRYGDLKNMSSAVGESLSTLTNVDIRDYVSHGRDESGLNSVGLTLH
jgi:hypothetical protein